MKSICELCSETYKEKPRCAKLKCPEYESIQSSRSVKIAKDNVWVSVEYAYDPESILK
jgi:hypothetical protein